MSEICQITGTITTYVTGGGPSASVVLGSPTITPSSTTGPQVTFDESFITYYTIPIGAPTTISLVTMTDVDLIYVGVDAACTLTLIPAASITLAADGFILISKGSITSLAISADAVPANVSIVALGT